MYQLAYFLSLLLCTVACANDRAPTLQSNPLPPLTAPVANNAVTAVTADDVEYLVSFAGIGSGLEHSDAHARTFVFSARTSTWSEHAAVPGGAGRLATTAASVGERAFVFGGYTVAENGDEISTPWVHSFDPTSGVFVERSPIPVPVDDAVSVTYQDRYIYLISGWHDYGNVNLVQIYDTATDTWSQGTPIPGSSLFGHAGGIVADKVVYCDGVAVIAHKDGPRSFAASDECWIGLIDPENHRRMDWRPIEKHAGLPRYRMAAAGIEHLNSVLFIGGSENPYNFNGVGYDGRPSQPSHSALLFSLETMTWHVIEQDNAASMDHRGLLPFRDGWVTVGGMLSGQAVTDSVIRYSLSPRR